MPEFGDKMEIIIVTTLVVTSTFFVWFLLAEHFDNKKRNDAIIRVQQYMYEKLIIGDMEQRFGDS